MFVGRTEILNRLDGLWQKATPSLVTVRGRRRIGKSTLVSEFARRTADHFISIDGQAPGEGVNNKVQLRSFMEQLAMQTEVPDVAVKNWLQAFRMLGSSLPKSGRVVVLLDEVSWMGGYDKSFAGTLKIVWDKMLKKRDNLVLVLCGSVSSWIADNILNGTGFVGRDSLDLVVGELPLSVCKAFWGAAAERTTISEMLDVLSVTGGVPKYLEEINPGLSSDENIRQLCFTREGMLFRDFNQIFNQIFGKKTQERKSLLRAIAYGSKSAAEIASDMGVERNGHLVDYLTELELAGFVSKESGINPCTGRPGRAVRYRLKDNYTRFYLHHVEPNAKEIESGLFKFDSLAALKGWDAVKGLQFENLVVSNFRSLLPALGIDGASLLSAAPYRRAREGATCGVQVDLLIQTKTTAYVVEIKRRNSIGAEIADEISDKAKVVGFRPGVSVRTALVYDGALAPSIRTEHMLDFVIPADSLFKWN